VAFSFRYDPQTQQFKKAYLLASNVVVEASNAAVFDAALAGVIAGRAQIAAAGFNKDWQKQLRFKMVTEKDSLKPRAYIHTAINYADIFETGKEIHGDPLIWLPLPSVPPWRGSGIRFGGYVPRRHMTPSQYVRTIGPLITLRRPGKHPILAAVIRRGTKAQPFGKFATRAQLKRGAKGRGQDEVIPLYVGVPSVRIGKKWNVTEALLQAANKIPQFYQEELKKLDAKRLAAGAGE